MGRLDRSKLSVTYLPGTAAEGLAVPRRYTLTHSDATGQLFLSIGSQYDKARVGRLYTRLMRDEVLAELVAEGGALIFQVYCHVSGGFVVGTARWRYGIFRSELPLALEAIRYGDRALFAKHPALDQLPVHIHFNSRDARFNKVEHWGVLADYSEHLQEVGDVRDEGETLPP